ncbi:MAG TPA: M1 family metallopeptidase [Acidobacteriaceae bacterium]|nr:M1 family metallopeptidase [Acidobacteriaceae bacterium]
MRRSCWCVLLLLMGMGVGAARPQTSAQSSNTTPGSAAAARRARHLDELKPPTKDDLLRGGYGPYRANNDLLSYALELRVDPVAETIKGSNTIRFRMLADGTRIQLELTPALHIDSLTFKGKPLRYTRADGTRADGTRADGTREDDTRTLWIDFPEMLRKGKAYDVVFAYSGHPVTQGRFGCFSFDKDKEGKPWITTACEGEGASVWWPNKDQWRDEPQDGMEIDVAVPDGLMDVSNGRFEGTKNLGDGYTEWRWHVHYPINNYDVALNIGEYQHWSGLHVNKETGQKTTLDFYALPEDLDKAKRQFEQVPTMLDAYEHYLGEYPFDKDGYKLVEVPYAGMEHQTAVAYGNHFENGYYGRDWTGVGISMKFDFIIIHESGHEWFGNAITAADRSDMWIHEGWTTYLETLYVEYRWGKADAIKYVNGLKPKVRNERPIIPPRGTNAEPPEDQYFKGALMLNTLRSVIGDDAKWFADVHDFYQHFQYQNIMTEDVVAWWNERTGMDLTPFFNEYLRHASIPVLEIAETPGSHTVSYRWKADEPGFAMPIRVGDPQHWMVVTPVEGEWKQMTWNGTLNDFQVATDLYYVNVDKTEAVH